MPASAGGAVAHLGERFNGIEEVGGSSPPSSTNLTSHTVPGGFSETACIAVIASVWSCQIPHNPVQSQLPRGELYGEKKMPRLNNLRIKSITSPGRYGDGNGLYLNVAKGGSTSWIQRITIKGRRRDIGLGGYPTVSLAQARRMAAENRTAVAEGRDPLAERRRASVPTFRVAATEFHAFNRPLWRSEHHAKTWLGMLEKHVFPRIGNMPVDEVKTEDIVAVLDPIWTKIPETARRVRQRVRAVFWRCMSKGYIEHNPAGEALDGAFLPVPRSKNHLRSLPYQDCPAALEAIEKSGASLASKLCLRFIILTAARYGEARYATWSEIDYDDKLWVIPASRMKMNVQHRVPLSDAAIAVLERAKGIGDGAGLIFPSPSPLKPGKALSENTLTKLLKQVDLHDRATVHGFRSSFRVWAAECTTASHAAMEISLAHSVGSSIEQAYARTDLLGQRRELMQQWADYLVKPSD